MKIQSTVLSVLSLLILATGCSKTPEPTPTPQATASEAAGIGVIKLTPEQLQNGNIQTADAKRQEIAQSFQALGEFRSKNRAKSMVEAPVGGRVVALLVDEGASVQLGQPVARIESPELSRLLAEHHHAQRKLELLESNAGQKILLAEQGPDTQAPLNQARTRLQKARAQTQAEEARLKEASLRKERLEKLIEVGIPSQEQVDMARADYLQALAALQAAQAEEKLAQDAFQKESLLDKRDARSAVMKRELSAELHLAREELRHQSELLKVLGKDSEEESPVITLTAPASGSVTSISTNVGEFVDTGQPLLEVVQSGDVYPVIWIPGSRVPEVAVGSEVEVFFSTDSPGYPAKITWLAPELDPETRTLAARLEFADKNLSARAGIFIKANVQTRKHSSLVVPLSAVTEVEGKQCVYIAAGERTFHRREVKTGVKSTDAIEILQGIEAGERCATEGVFLLKSYDLGTEGE